MADAITDHQEALLAALAGVLRAEDWLAEQKRKADALLTGIGCMM